MSTATETEATTSVESMPNGLVNLSFDGPVAILELNAPPANCYTHNMMRDIDEAILKARFNDDCFAIVITGSGDKFFSAGADIGMLNSVTPKFKYYFCLHANETLNRLEQTPKLVIAAINGHCVGGGLEIAMAADMRIAINGRGKVGLPEVNLGVLPGTGGTQRLARLIGKSKSMELMITGETFGAEKAKDLGIFNQVWDADSPSAFKAKVVEYAKDLCPPNKAGKAVGNIKRSVQSGAEVPFEVSLSIERELQQLLFQSADAKEGIASYVEKRKATFTGN
jgi:enoyl-CoA hydratase/carnithine racemase